MAADDAQGFRVVMRTYDTAIRLVVTGEVDIAGASDFDKAVRSAEDGSPETLVLDLKELEFMDSSGLRILLLAQRRAEESGRRLQLVPNDLVRRLLAVTGTESHFELTEEDELPEG